MTDIVITEKELMKELSPPTEEVLKDFTQRTKIGQKIDQDFLNVIEKEISKKDV